MAPLSRIFRICRGDMATLTIIPLRFLFLLLLLRFSSLSIWFAISFIILIQWIPPILSFFHRKIPYWWDVCSVACKGMRFPLLHLPTRHPCQHPPTHPIPANVTVSTSTIHPIITVDATVYDHAGWAWPWPIHPSQPTNNPAISHLRAIFELPSLIRILWCHGGPAQHPVTDRETFPGLYRITGMLNTLTKEISHFKFLWL